MTSRNLQHVAGGLVLAGLAIAGYLTWAHFAGADVVCLRGGGCETVQKSSYSEIAGIPVAVLGLAFYGTMFFLLGWDSEDARFVGAALATVGVVFSVYLVVVQTFVIDAFCIWCLANDVVVAPALALVVALRLRNSE